MRRGNPPTKEQLKQVRKLIESGKTMKEVCWETGISLYYIRQLFSQVSVAVADKNKSSARLFTPEEYEEWCKEWNHWTNIIRKRLVKKR